MRIVGWAEFATLPAGTFYQIVDAYHLGRLSILGGVLSHDGKPADFVEANMLPSAMDSSYFGQGTFEHGGVTIPDGCPIVMWPSHFGRDGLFEHDRRFMIWEQADRERLAGWLLDPAKALSDQNDDEGIILMIEGDR